MSESDFPRRVRPRSSYKTHMARFADSTETQLITACGMTVPATELGNRTRPPLCGACVQNATGEPKSKRSW